MSQAIEVHPVTALIAAVALATPEPVLAAAPMENPAQPEEEIGVYWAEKPVRNQQQLAEKVTLYWAALCQGDYKTVYDMYPSEARSMISYPEWLSMNGILDGEPEPSECELVSAVIEGIRCTDNPNFSHLYEVFTHLRIRLPDGTLEEGVQPNLWELTDEGTWFASLAVIAGQ